MKQLTYDPDKKAFLIKDDGDELTVPFAFSDLNHKRVKLTVAEAGDYEYVFYYKKDVKELDFLQTLIKVGEDPKRLGWLLPMATLTTIDEDILKKEHMNQYVFFAYCHLLELREVQDRLDEGDTFDVILEELFPDGSLLIVNKSLMPGSITLKHLELSMARHGYYLKPSGYANPVIANKDIITLIPCAEILKDDGNYIHEYIEDFLAHHVFHHNSFIRFLYLYQIEEVLMDKEMIELLKDYLYLLEQNQPNYRKIENGLKESTESKRLASIVLNAHLHSTISNQLDSKCNTFLNSDADSLLTQPESIYQVRNHIVHRFRVASSEEAAVKEICDYLELYLFDLLICYKKPKVNRPVVVV